MLRTTMIAIVLHCGALLGGDFFPLQDGNTWTYREPVTGQTFSVRVGSPVTTAGHVYYRLSGYVDSDVLVRVEEVYGALVYWDQGRNQEILLTSFEQFEGGYWVAPFRTCPDEAGQGQLKRGTHDGPTGVVRDVLEIRYRAFGCADTGVVQEQYAERLGMLRRVQTTFAGSRTFDLVSARVGNITIDAAPVGRFSVSVGPTSNRDVITATFRLQVNAASPLVLSFPSGQEYDFSLYDSMGNPVWTWSTTATTLESPHQRSVTGEWSVTVEIPLSAISRAVKGGPAAGDFTVRAWITATGATPFAATVPVTALR